MKTLDVITGLMLIIGLAFLISWGRADDTAVQLHTYEIVYNGVNSEWQDALIKDTIRVPKIMALFLAHEVGEPEETWLLIQYEDGGTQPMRNYVHTDKPAFFDFDFVTMDNLVGELISFREIDLTQ